MADPVIDPVTPEADPIVPANGDTNVADPVVKGTTPEDDKVTTFTQDQLNKIVGERLSKEKKAHDDAISELNTLRKKSEMNSKDRTEWESKYNQLVEKNMTAEELKEREFAKTKKEKEELVSSLTAEKEFWEDQFKTSLISNSIKDASIEYDAFSAQQIENNLRNFMKVVPVKDEEGKDTKVFNVRVDFPDKDGDGKDIMMNLSTMETVARMKDVSQYQNLFKGGIGGVGQQNEDSSEVGSAEFYANQGADVYMKAYKDGKIKLK